MMTTGVEAHKGDSLTKDAHFFCLLRCLNKYPTGGGQFWSCCFELLFETLFLGFKPVFFNNKHFFKQLAHKNFTRLNVDLAHSGVFF